MQHNKIERLKAQLPPSAFLEKIGTIDLENLTEADRFYLKNYGIYNIKLRPERFMLRLRIAGGRVEKEKLERLLAVVKEENLELLLTARAQIELHGLCAQNILRLWHRVQEIGFTTLQTLTDNFRNIVTDPYDGLAKSSMLEVYPLIEQMQAHFLNRPEWMGMIPRKFNTAITATHASGMHFFGNDLFFAPAKKDNLNGFNVYLGGKNSHTARCADIFVLPHEVPEMFLSIAKAYSRHGLRGSRAKTRLFHLLASISMAQFRAYVAAIYSKPIRSAGTLQLQKYHAKQLETLKDGSFGLRIQSRYGRIDTQTLTKIVAFAKEQGAQIRLGADQNIYLVGLKERQHPFSKSEHAQITACAGSHFCALSLWDIKAETSYLPQHLLHKYNISVGFSGCLKGCGRHHHADIGLVGLRTNLFGPVIKAARLFLGSEYTQTQKPARLIYHVVPLEKLSALIEVIVDEFLSSLEADFEDFSRNHLNRYSSEFLMLWFLSKLYLKEKIAFEGREESELYALLKEREDFPKVEEKPDSYEEAVRVLMHTLWDVSQKEA